MIHKDSSVMFSVTGFMMASLHPRNVVNPLLESFLYVIGARSMVFHAKN